MGYWYKNKQYNTIIQALAAAHDIAREKHKGTDDFEIVFNAPESDSHSDVVAFVYASNVVSSTETSEEDVAKINRFNNAIMPYDLHDCKEELHTWISYGTGSTE